MPTSSSFLIVLACLLIAAKIAGYLSQKIRIPAVLGQLTIGIVVGPSVLGWLHPEPLINSFASLGVILLMFIAGLETDMMQMRRVGGAALVSACLGVILPFVTSHGHKREYICSNVERIGQTPHKRGNDNPGSSSDR